MKKIIFLGILFSIYACSDQGNDRNDSMSTRGGPAGDTSSVHDKPNNTGMGVSDTSTSIAHDTSARKP